MGKLGLGCSGGGGGAKEEPATPTYVQEEFADFEANQHLCVLNFADFETNQDRCAIRGRFPGGVQVRRRPGQVGAHPHLVSVTR
ncbi:hypothetical protein CEXT_361311 [Caerostris extrusa]|uniref:Uncharacterized protein n=1 Tax=Caerostris extrusa TaxID=172846 RepID=A0AAV4XSG2_CAEEX|nr:hypothetical protein CEXT_361311 [Caerostris extrusa]